METIRPSKRLKIGDDGVDEDTRQRLIIVLEKCRLECAKVGKSWEILSSDKHASFLQKKQMDPALYRPDILHQCLLMLLDSPLNRAGLLQIFISTVNSTLIQVNPQTRIPRTFSRFCGLMAELLHKRKIRAADKSITLLRVIRNPIDMYLPNGCQRLVTSFSAEQFVSCRKIAESALKKPIVVVVGAFAKGKVKVDYAEDEVKVSNFPLSAALTCSKLTTAFEEVWDVEKI